MSSSAGVKNFPRRISPSIYVLGNAYFQSFLVRGECCALIEGGVSCSVPLLVKQLKKLQIPAGELQYLIISHAHFDHVCGVPGLKEAFPQVQVLASATAAKVLSKEKVIAGFFAEDKFLRENMAELTNNLEQTNIKPPATITIDSVIKEGDRLVLGRGCSLEFFQLPGHSPCGLGAYLAVEQVLFPSDSGGYPLNEDIMFPVYFAGYEDYLASLKRLAEFKSEVLAAPHEVLLTGREEISSFLRRSYADTVGLYQSILQDYRAGKSREDISGALFQKFYIGGMTNYSEGNIRLCTDLLVRRTLETVGS
ncbi:MAG: MBL fold metallo-hydrolase [Carboxydocellales bacterium]